MEKRTLGRTGYEVTRVALGTYRFTSEFGVPRADALALLERAVDLGINYMDTAPSYGCGESEELIGRVLARLPDSRSSSARRSGSCSGRSSPTSEPRPTAARTASAASSTTPSGCCGGTASTCCSSTSRRRRPGDGTTTSRPPCSAFSRSSGRKGSSALSGSAATGRRFPRASPRPAASTSSRSPTATPCCSSR